MLTSKEDKLDIPKLQSFPFLNRYTLLSPFYILIKHLKKILVKLKKKE